MSSTAALPRTPQSIVSRGCISPYPLGARNPLLRPLARCVAHGRAALDGEALPKGLSQIVDKLTFLRRRKTARFHLSFDPVDELACVMVPAPIGCGGRRWRRRGS